MYEEPYRWVEAVGNRRQYLNQQFKQGSPVVAFSYSEGTLLLTLSRGTAKLYEIYDRIGLGGMGHPADLEKLRFSLLEMAHLEGFNRSPTDVTGARLMKYGMAPVIKQAFEEVFKAPFIVKILLTELGLKPGKDSFLTLNYDGSFEEVGEGAVLAATPKVQEVMMTYLRSKVSFGSIPLDSALDAGLRTWAVGSLAQQSEQEEENRESEKHDALSKPDAEKGHAYDESSLVGHLKEAVAEKTIECAVMERHLAGPSKYRTLNQDELKRLLPQSLQQ